MTTPRIPRPLALSFVVVANIIVVIRANLVVPDARTIATWIATPPRPPPRSPRPPHENAIPSVVGRTSTSHATPPHPRAYSRSSSSSLNLLNWDNGDARDEGGGMAGGEETSMGEHRVPFVIQNIGRGSKDEIDEIVRLCIDVFFNDENDERGRTYGGVGRDRRRTTTPWKELQLAYLRNFQRGDILARNAFRREQLVDLIVARRVYPVIDGMGTTTNGRIDGTGGGDVIDDVERIHNLETMTTSARTMYYRTGEIIGYCEVSEKNFGLGDNYENDNGNLPRRRRRRTKDGNESIRPYLSNLSVVECARGSGVGSELLESSVHAVRSWNANHTEIVLQVEEDNTNAIQFYKRRGWEFVFADPTCRRYDTSGIFLRETRITKYAMVKRLDDNDVGSNRDENEKATNMVGSQFLQRLRSSFFVQ